MSGRDIIVVGASVGGVQALSAIARGLPADLHSAIFVVLHLWPHGRSYLPDILQDAGFLPAAHAQEGEPITPGRIYVAPPDHHLMIAPGRVRVSRGPKENRARPAIDPLFRSAGLAYGRRVVGVVLTGRLDDGAAGLWAIKALGGVAIVQDPHEAEAPQMPLSAMRQTRVDYCLPLEAIPDVLTRLASEIPAEEKRAEVPRGLEAETRIAMEADPLAAGVFELGDPSLLTCPDCHGALLRLKTGGGLRPGSNVPILGHDPSG
jgi:two-component system chemotaxis response regulator CheB